MARLDDYIAAKKIALQKLSEKSFDEIAQCAAFETADPNVFRVPFLDRVYRISFPGFNFEDEADQSRDIPIQEQILILHYMQADSPRKSSGNWIAYREIPGASFYFSAFVKRAIEPLKKAFGQNVSGLVQTSGQLGGKAVKPGDAAFEYKIFPKVPLQVILWEGDHEFPAEANILFDKTIGDIFSPEDIAWLAGMLVYRLIALSSK
ncbi:DUF3786 domain-containing protein [Thermodesulfobacteriota bacterium]